MRPPNRRAFLQQLGPAGVAAIWAQARADGACLQTDTVRWIVPNAVGGGYDTYSRLIEPYLERKLGVSIHVDNLAGAGGLRGMTALREARADGATLGIVNMAGLLMASITRQQSIDPIRGFTLLGTIARSSHVWATSASSGFRSIEQLMEAGGGRGLVIGVTSFHNLGFLLPALTAALLGWKVHFVSGYGGSVAKAMAAIRGEVDLISSSWDVLIDRVRAGDLRPILAMDADATEAHPLLHNVAALSGEDGLIAQLAPDSAAEAEALVRFMQAGRVIVAPPGLPPELERCLGEAICQVLFDPRVAEAGAARASRVQPACAEETRVHVRAAQADAQQLKPLAREAIARAQR